MTIDKEQRWPADMSVIDQFDQSASVCLWCESERAGACAWPRCCERAARCFIQSEHRAAVSMRRRMKSRGPSCDQIIDPRWWISVCSLAADQVVWSRSGCTRRQSASSINQSINQPHWSHLMWDNARSGARAAAGDNQLRGGRSYGSDAAGSGLWTGFWIMWPTSRKFDSRWRWSVSGGTSRWSGAADDPGRSSFTHRQQHKQGTLIPFTRRKPHTRLHLKVCHFKADALACNSALRENKAESFPWTLTSFSLIRPIVNKSMSHWSGKCVGYWIWSVVILMLLCAETRCAGRRETGQIWLQFGGFYSVEFDPTVEENISHVTEFECLMTKKRNRLIR